MSYSQDTSTGILSRNSEYSTIIRQINLTTGNNLINASSTSLLSQHTSIDPMSSTFESTTTPRESSTYANTYISTSNSIRTLSSSYSTSIRTTTTEAITATTTALTPFEPSTHPEIFTSEFLIQNLNTSTYLSALNSVYDLNDCLVNCSNRGDCKYYSNTTFTCNCYANYTGRICSVNTDPCEYMPCLNNGTCVPTSSNSSYYCECGASYYGGNCEQSVDFCELANETCSGNGYCSSQNAVINCTCFNSFTGEHCQIKSRQLQIKQALISTATIIAIIAIFVFYTIFITMDIMKYSCRKTKIHKKSKTIFKRFNKISHLKS